MSREQFHIWVKFTRDVDTVRPRVLDFMTYKAQTSIIDFMSLLGANAYYRLLFVEVENQRHAMNFLSILAPEVASCYTKTCMLYLSRVHRADVNGMGAFSIRNIEANDLRARK